MVDADGSKSSNRASSAFQQSGAVLRKVSTINNKHIFFFQHCDSLCSDILNSLALTPPDFLGLEDLDEEEEDAAAAAAAASASSCFLVFSSMVRA